MLIVPLSALPSDYHVVHWQETNYQSTRGGLGPLKVSVFLPPLGAARPAFVTTRARQALVVLDAYGRMVVAPEEATDLWPALLRVKAALRDHVTWRRLDVEAGVFVPATTYPMPRFDPREAMQPGRAGASCAGDEPSSSPSDEGHLGGHQGHEKDVRIKR
ncbi:MAG: hypothetical protein NZ533_01340 [Casimicrobiaceae bacterium]|nr:hypothetical protein [Casimicrobiaceae bacterium]MDW8311204.1 hypothetical protein [Burkholderiales bacterium]